MKKPIEAETSKLVKSAIELNDTAAKRVEKLTQKLQALKNQKTKMLEKLNLEILHTQKMANYAIKENRINKNLIKLGKQITKKLKKH